MRLKVAVLLYLISAAVLANELISRRQPVVVYESQSTVSAWPYYKRLEQGSQFNNQVDVPEGAGIKPMAEQLPLMTAKLRVGKPEMRIQEGQVIPLFIMGMDPVSLNWFSRAAEGLADIGARGVVVQAADAIEWQSLQQNAKARGIDLILLAGDSLADGYQIDTYPMVIVSPALAGEAFGE
jgi:integrating conjugative element protein (TIGR03765 family)